MDVELSTLRAMTEAAQQNVRAAIARRAGRAELKNLVTLRNNLERAYVAAQEAAA